MEDQKPASANSAIPSSRLFKLPDFWTGSLAAWFRIAEAQFKLHGALTQRDKFALVSAVLPETSACCVVHLLVARREKCYNRLITALFAAHQLTVFQKAEKLL